MFKPIKILWNSEGSPNFRGFGHSTDYKNEVLNFTFSDGTKFNNANF